jgi:hypothetical protein
MREIVCSPARHHHRQWALDFLLALFLFDVRPHLIATQSAEHNPTECRRAKRKRSKRAEALCLLKICPREAAIAVDDSSTLRCSSCPRSFLRAEKLFPTTSRPAAIFFLGGGGGGTAGSVSLLLFSPQCSFHVLFVCHS